MDYGDFIRGSKFNKAEELRRERSFENVVFGMFHCPSCAALHKSPLACCV